MHKAATTAGHAIAGVRAGADQLAAHKLVADRPATIVLRSHDFNAGQPLPISCTADGQGQPPQLAWDAVPKGTVSLALICEAPDAPLPEPVVHWIVYAIPATAHTIMTPPPTGAIEGLNSALTSGYLPAAPLPGHGVHHYHFQLFALDTVSTLAPHVGRGALLEHMRDHVIAWGQLVGTYQRR